ncbi:MAG: DUF6390 family protein [Candidatus Buchananbacteria bacterium]
MIREKPDGMILAARYAFMPNKLRYCGGDRNSQLFSYVSAGFSDGGLGELLEEFDTMFPYVSFIAHANKIADPFDYRVVEAYWIGNDLLDRIDFNAFYRYMVDIQRLPKSYKPELAEKIYGKIPLGAKPHHSWHVFNIPKRMGPNALEYTIATMDDCRISWAKVLKSDPVADGLLKKIKVECRPLQYLNNQLILGEPQEKEVWFEYGNKSFTGPLQAGDLITLHWNWACDRISEEQKNNLEKWTRHNLKLANL